MKLSYTITEACHALGIGRTKLYELIAAGTLIPCKIGARTVIEARELEAFLVRMRRAA